MKSLFPSHIDLTAKVMDLRLQRQNIVSANLANINTPGYKARRLEFEQDLQAALDDSGTLAKTHPKHLPNAFAAESFAGNLTKEFEPRVVQGVDNVDLDTEMATMAKNNLLYNALATVIHKSFTGMKQTIQDGGK